jgi:NAD(P)-dependent dehydrogenase (short-subunit alcohol dehydrogenase family)
MDIAIVTGAGSGLGLAITRKLIELGLRVYGLGGQYDDARFDNEYFVPMPCNMGDMGDVRAKVAEIVKREGDNIYVLVNNAKLYHHKGFDEISDEEMEAALKVNLLSPLVITKMALPSLNRLGGFVINIVANTAENARGGAMGAATAGGLRWMGEALFEQLRENGVKVSNVFPQTNKWRPDGSVPAQQRPQSAIDIEAVAEAVGSIVLNRFNNVVTDIVIRPQRLAEKPVPAPYNVPYPKPKPLPKTAPREEEEHVTLAETRAEMRKESDLVRQIRDRDDVVPEATEDEEIRPRDRRNRDESAADTGPEDRDYEERAAIEDGDEEEHPYREDADEGEAGEEREDGEEGAARPETRSDDRPGEFGTDQFGHRRHRRGRRGGRNRHGPGERVGQPFGENRPRDDRPIDRPAEPRVGDRPAEPRGDRPVRDERFPERRDERLPRGERVRDDRPRDDRRGDRDSRPAREERQPRDDRGFRPERPARDFKRDEPRSVRVNEEAASSAPVEGVAKPETARPAGRSERDERFERETRPARLEREAREFERPVEERKDEREVRPAREERQPREGRGFNRDNRPAREERLPREDRPQRDDRPVAAGAVGENPRDERRPARDERPRQENRERGFDERAARPEKSEVVANGAAQQAERPAKVLMRPAAGQQVVTPVPLPKPYVPTGDAARRNRRNRRPGSLPVASTPIMGAAKPILPVKPVAQAAARPQSQPSLAPARENSRPATRNEAPARDNHAAPAKEQASEKKPEAPKAAATDDKAEKPKARRTSTRKPKAEKPSAAATEAKSEGSEAEAKPKRPRRTATRTKRPAKSEGEAPAE